VFLRKNILLAAIREEEKGGREDWETKIPRTIELLQSNTSSEMLELLHELNLNIVDRQKMTISSQNQITHWSDDERKIAQLVEDESIKELRVPGNYTQSSELFQYWNE
jgi:hypothetical protein